MNLNPHCIPAGFASFKNPDTKLEQEQQEYLDIIIHESNRLSQLATNVLNLSKIENLNILSDMELFDLTEEVRQSVLLLESKWQKNMELIIDMEEIEYYGSRNLLNQVWINLIDNAIKFSRPRQNQTETSPVRHLCLHILDNGCGMSEETSQHIFDRFYQGDLFPYHGRQQDRTYGGGRSSAFTVGILRFTARRVSEPPSWLPCRISSPEYVAFQIQALFIKSYLSGFMAVLQLFCGNCSVGNSSSVTSRHPPANKLPLWRP